MKGKKCQLQKHLKNLNWKPIELKSKEGLALINGTQFMSAYGLYNLIQCDRLLKWADIIAAIILMHLIALLNLCMKIFMPYGHIKGK